MASIKDIAKKAGVSISTVSYALNGSPKVTDETCARILAIAKELNYVPNAAARSLKKKESKIIGAFLPDFSGGFYGDLLQGMKGTLIQKGYDLVVCSGPQSHRLLAEKLFDGALILDHTFSDEQLLNFAELEHRLVVLDRELKHPNINHVLLDNKAGASLAMEYLIDLGHRKIYVVTGPEGSYDSKQRMAAVRQTVERNSDVECIEIPGDFNRTGGERAGKQIAAEFEGPVAVFCLNDEMAIGMYDYISETDLEMGKDIHIIGFDNIELSEYIRPRLATIDYSKKKWGSLASEQLIKIIEGKPVENERIYVTLVKAESVKPV